MADQRHLAARSPHHPHYGIGTSDSGPPSPAEWLSRAFDGAGKQVAHLVGKHREWRTASVRSVVLDCHKQQYAARLQAASQVLGIPMSLLGWQRHEAAAVQRRGICAIEVEEVTFQDRNAGALPAHEAPDSSALNCDMVLGKEGTAGDRRDFDADDVESVRSEPSHVG